MSPGWKDPLDDIKRVRAKDRYKPGSEQHKPYLARNPDHKPRIIQRVVHKPRRSGFVFRSYGVWGSGGYMGRANWPMAATLLHIQHDDSLGFLRLYLACRGATRFAIKPIPEGARAWVTADFRDIPGSDAVSSFRLELRAREPHRYIDQAAFAFVDGFISRLGKKGATAVRVTLDDEGASAPMHGRRPSDAFSHSGA